MIYIDPPYNTGNDFVYHDDLKDPVANYKELTGQTLRANPETTGRYHSNWLNMMYPRLLIARSFLRDDGVIFISIDDHEVHNLRKLCDEVFGEENFRNMITIRRGAKSVQAQFSTWDKLGQDLEYILFYTKNSQYRFPKQLKKLEDTRSGTWNNHWRGTDRPSMRYEIFGIKPENGQWRWSKERSLQAIENYKNMLQELGETNETISQEKIDLFFRDKGLENYDMLRLSKSGKPEHYIPESSHTLLNSSWVDLVVGNSSEVMNLFNHKLFDTPKLTSTIRRMLNFTEADDLILDFFSGSATTAHAVMQLNAEDGGKRRFIMVQLPEKTAEDSEAYRAGYKTIADIGRERIRRAGEKIKAENQPIAYDLDIGFRSFKLDSSNLKQWNSDFSGMTQEQQWNLFLERAENALESFIPGRSELDIIYETLLKYGLPLTEKLSTMTIEGKQFYVVGEDGYVVICLEQNIKVEMIEQLINVHAPGAILFAQHCFADDSALANSELILQDAEIEFRWI
nr:site-specific DNA-methyltransferase [Bartonella queenslandensis]